MNEKTKQAIEGVFETDLGMAQLQVEKTIGEAVLELLRSGRTCDQDALLNWFEEAISSQPQSGVRRKFYAAAQTALRDAMSRTGR